MAELEVEVKSRAKLRDWLAANHATSGSVWLVVYKKHTPHYLPWGDAVSELLCWGWVDSVTRRVDDDRSSYRIAPRNPRSAWSAVNKAKVAEARAQGLMQPSGEAVIAKAQTNGMWEFLDDVEAGTLPDDLAQALDESGARGGWEAYPRSVTRGTLEWIKTAKSPATRSRRIDDVVKHAGRGERPSPFQRG
ncbi:YdeI family protein [Marimonas sp. MJW-29]|uniref:YdeI family protein n=1 Tax=Sulfitobacter sediminis TaxID=3234186 RepID=A0ABV3RHV2_9RHOB